MKVSEEYFWSAIHSLGLESFFTGKACTMVELRKLQKTGGTTYFITLPKNWIRQRGLTTGDLVQLLNQPGGHLLLTPLDTTRQKVSGFQDEGRSPDQLVEHAEGQRVQLDVTKSPDLARDILDYYMQGLDVIRIVAPPTHRITPAHRFIVKSITQKLVGVETIDEDQHSITLQCLINPNILPLATVLKRTFKIASAMHVEATQSLVTLDPDLARAVMSRDEEVDRLYFLAVRQLRALLADPITASRVNISPLKALDHRLLAKHIEVLADYAAEIASITRQIYDLYMKSQKQSKKRTTVSLPSKITTLLADLSRQAEARLADAVKAYWNHDTIMAADLMQLGHDEEADAADDVLPYLESLLDLTELQGVKALHPHPKIHNQILALLAAALSLLTRINDLATDIGGLVTNPSNNNAS